MVQKSLFDRLRQCEDDLAGLRTLRVEGRVVEARGLILNIAGTNSHVSLGDWVAVTTRDGAETFAEIVGFKGAEASAMPFGRLDGLGPGSTATVFLPLERDGARGPQPIGPQQPGTLAVSDQWLGRVVDPLGNPLDGLGTLPHGPHAITVRRTAPPATQRARLGARLDFGVCALNTFTTCRLGQRLGLFAGSGVGKSTLLATLAEQTVCDVTVLALIGERGREVREFLEETLGEAGLARSVIVVATSDAAPLLRRQAAYTAMAIAEYFRDAGQSVLMLMDSVTRFCLALREIGLATGEPPATRGYPPSVFAELPAMLERAGPGIAQPNRPPGYITGIFSVLVEGDDMNEPVADAVRGLLDGHVILDRRIAEAGRFPPVDVLRSLSRTLPGCQTPAEQAIVQRCRALLSLSAEMSDLVRLGAYRSGTDQAADEAIALAPRIEMALRQERGQPSNFADSFARLQAAITPDMANGQTPER